MKSLILIAICLFTLNGIAQEHEPREMRKKMEKIRSEMTAEDIAGLKTKKMTLRLDLTEVQQKKAYDLVLAEAEQRKTMKAKHKAYKEGKKELTKNDFVTTQNERLDRKIAFKAEMKTILTDEQYEKFDKMKPRGHKHKRKHRDRS